MLKRTTTRWLAVLAAGTVALAACSNDDGSMPTSTTVPGSPMIVWQVDEVCADSLIASDRIVVANCDGGVQAHARSDGTFLWGAESNDDGQSIPGITEDEVVVYTPLYDAQPLAFDGRTGEEVEVPTAGVRTTYTGFEPPADEVLPPGYSYDDRGLNYRETLIWAGGRPDETGTGLGPYVHRQGGVTVINDFETGMRVVADDGTVLLAPALGPLWYGSSPVWDLGDGEAAVATTDGVLYLLDLGTGLQPSERDRT